MKRKKQYLLICIFLAVLTLVIFAPVAYHDFTNYDDPDYVTENSIVQRGLTMEGIIWAFQAGYFANWHPLTWLSHMLDCEIFGTSPAGHHLINLLFHVLNTLLLFSILAKATKTIWRSAIVAALFAVHPMHIESVAWVSERKDVLSTFFLLLAVGAYFRFCKTDQSSVDFNGRKQRWRKDYFLTLLFFALGLMSKPMLVTLPFVLLLLDVWPLQRISFAPFNLKKFGPLFVEKIPFFALSIVSSFVTFYAQKEAGAVSTLTLIPLSARISNTVVSYWRYVEKLFWPFELSVLYPLRSWPLWLAVLSGISLVVVSALAVRAISRHPYFAVGWFWFLGTLVPVIGLVQVGVQSMADRYSYVPFIGLFIALIWSAHDLLAKVSKRLLIAFATIVVTACAVSTSFQLFYWQNSLTLFEQAFAVTGGNYTIHANYGLALAASGQYDKALVHFSKALQLRPQQAEAYHNFGTALKEKGETDEALRFYRESVRLNPEYFKVRFSLAKLLLERGEISEAIEHLAFVTRVKPDFAPAHFQLGRQLAKQGKFAEAIGHYKSALKIDPRDDGAHYNLANALLQRGEIDEAIMHYRAVLKENPSDVEARNNLASALQRQGNFAEADQHFLTAIRIRPDYSEAHFNLALNLMKQGKNRDAITHLQEAARLQPENPEFHYQLATLMVGLGHIESAIKHFREALVQRPDWPEALNFLARILATSRDSKLRNGDEAIKLAEHACKLVRFENLFYLDTLGAAFAEKGDFAEAIRVTNKAKEIAIASGEKAAGEQIESHIRQYQSGQPLREF